MKTPFIGCLRGLDVRAMEEKDFEDANRFAEHPDQLVRCRERVDPAFLSTLLRNCLVEEWNERNPGLIITRCIFLARPCPFDAGASEIVYFSAQTREYETWLLSGFLRSASSCKRVFVRKESLREEAFMRDAGFQDDPNNPEYLVLRVPSWAGI